MLDLTTTEGNTRQLQLHPLRTSMLGRAARARWVVNRAQPVFAVDRRSVRQGPGGAFARDEFGHLNQVTSTGSPGLPPAAAPLAC